MNFQAVKPIGRYTDPGDLAITRKLLELVAMPDVATRIALLTSDTDFVQIMQEITDSGKSVLAVMPEEYEGNIREYDAGLKLIM